jgi:hypothetical protein
LEAGIARKAAMIIIPLTPKVVVRTAQPVVIGDRNPVQSRTMRIEFSVLAPVKDVLFVTAGTFVNVQGQPGVFTELVKYTP